MISTTNSIRFTGPLRDLRDKDRAAMFDRATSVDASVRQRTVSIIADVRTRGDVALRAMSESFDNVTLDELEVPQRARCAALDALPAALRRALERSATNIARVHRDWLPSATECEVEPGLVVGRRPDPLDRVGVYAPGGRAVYPSSVLMGVVPARLAGVREIIMCSPPQRDGAPSPIVLAAAELAGVDRVFALGGAGAIAAMAYGTPTVPRVDRIVGPGNAYVAEAKLQVVGSVAIDGPAGPSELLVIADDSCDARRVALEMIAQAEHDPHACVVAIAIGATVASAVEDALGDAIGTQPRRAIIAESLATNGAILSVESLDDAIAFANAYAPEHLLLAVRAEDALSRIQNAGTVFLGDGASVAFGDYMTGANHVLPTGGAARSYSGLSTLDFVRWTTYQRISESAGRSIASDTAAFATAEELLGHAAAAMSVANDCHHERSAGSAFHGSPANADPSLAKPALMRSGGLARDDRFAGARPSYRGVSGYAPEPHSCAIDLSDNTNLWGAPPGALAAVRTSAEHALARYPETYAESLKETIAAQIGLPASHVVTGCGSDDLLDCAIRAFAEPGDRLATADPSFAMVPLFAKLNGLSVTRAPLTDRFDIDVDRVAEADVVYLCSPNNPTGTELPRASLEALLSRARGVVIVDEAYADFGGRTATDLVATCDRLLVTRTLSKAYGLAGLRVGYAIGAPSLIVEVEKARGPYKVSSVGAAAAISALTVDRSWVFKHVNDAIRNRERFAVALRTLGLSPLASAANFVLAAVSNAVDVARGLRERGVAVRAFQDLPLIDDTLRRSNGAALRITIGPWKMMQPALDALREVLRPCA